VRRIAPSQYLLEVRLLREKVPSFLKYPFSLPVVRHLRTLRFHPKVTFIIGENATGKSTLVEAIAVSCGLNPWEKGTRPYLFLRGSFQRLGVKRGGPGFRGREAGLAGFMCGRRRGREHPLQAVELIPVIPVGGSGMERAVFGSGHLAVLLLTCRDAEPA